MNNYFSYFSEIEQRFQQRRGSILLLSTLDWALIETWREAGVPLAAVLRGIDDAFDKYEQRAARAGAAKGRLRKINGLAWAAQSVMLAAQAAAEAATGLESANKEPVDTGLENQRIAAYLRENATKVEQAAGDPAIAARLRELALQVEAASDSTLEDLDRTLTVLEEKLYAGLLASTPEVELVALKAQAAREMAPYRSRMQTVQLRQVEQQLLHKRLLEARGLPRLSLFFMNVA